MIYISSLWQEDHCEKGAQCARAIIARRCLLIIYSPVECDVNDNRTINFISSGRERDSIDVASVPHQHAHSIHKAALGHRRFVRSTL